MLGIGLVYRKQEGYHLMSELTLSDGHGLIDLDGVQATAQVPLEAMKWPLPDPCVDLSAQIAGVVHYQGCLRYLIDLDGVQAAAQVPLETMNWSLPGPCVDLTAQTAGVVHYQGCLRYLINMDGVQVSAQVPLEQRKWPLPGLCV